jgi:hypothetical protein
LKKPYIRVPRNRHDRSVAVLASPLGRREQRRHINTVLAAGGTFQMKRPEVNADDRYDRDILMAFSLQTNIFS